MAEQGFEVVLTAELDGDREPDEVREALAELFKLSSEEASRLMGAAPVTVKRGLDEQTAAKYKVAIEQTGARCEVRVEASGPTPPAPATAASPPAPPAPPPATDRPGSSAGREPPPSAATGVHAARTLPVGRALGWLGDAWGLFTRAPLTWVLMWLAFVVLLFVLMLVPVLNIVAGFLLPPLLTGGAMVAAQTQHDGADASVGQLFEGFSRRPGPLLGVGGIYVLLSILAGVVILALAFGLGLGGAVLGNLSAGGGGAADPAVALLASGGAMTLGLLAVLVSLLVYAAIWFAPPLVILGGLGPVEACKQSLLGCLRNWLLMLVFSLVVAVLCMIAVVPAGLGLLVLGPVLMLTIFVGYRDIFVA